MLKLKRRRRLFAILAMIIGMGTTVSLVLFALNKNINVYYTPSQMLSNDRSYQHRSRLGGLVKKGSFQREPNSLTVHFIVTDFTASIPVVYSGVLPALFREGQGVVVEGKLNQGKVFQANQVLAKHDEKYMPPNLAGIKHGNDQ